METTVKTKHEKVEESHENVINFKRVSNSGCRKSHRNLAIMNRGQGILSWRDKDGIRGEIFFFKEYNKKDKIIIALKLYIAKRSF